MREKAKIWWLLFGCVVVTAAFLQMLFRQSGTVSDKERNAGIQASGARMLMTREELRSKLHEQGTIIPAMGGEVLLFRDQGLTVGFPSDGKYRNRINSIQTTNPQHVIFGIQVGSLAEEAEKMWKGQRFKPEDVFGLYRRGDVQLQFVLSDDRQKVKELMVSLIDPSVQDRNY